MVPIFIAYLSSIRSLKRGNQSFFALASGRPSLQFSALFSSLQPNDTYFQHTGMVVMHISKSVGLLITIFCLGSLAWNISAQVTPTGVWEIEWSPDGEQLAMADWNGLVYILNESGTLQHTLSGHSRRASTVAWSPDGAILATGGDDQFVNLWNPSTGTLTHQILPNINALYEGVAKIAWSPDGEYLLATSFDTFQFWETASWMALEPYRTGTLIDAQWNPDGSLLAVTDIYYLSFFNGQTLTTDNLDTDAIFIPEEHPGNLAWNDKSERLAVVDRYDPRVSIWDVPTRSRIAMLNTTGSLFTDVVFVGSDQVAAVTEDGTLYLLDTSASVLATFETGMVEARSLAWNPQQQLFAIGGAQTVVDETGVSGLSIVPMNALLPDTPDGCEAAAGVMAEGTPPRHAEKNDRPSRNDGRLCRS
jgi:WD40 repeat protein